MPKLLSGDIADPDFWVTIYLPGSTELGRAGSDWLWDLLETPN